MDSMTTTWDSLVVIDFEASSLPMPGSYPIEVAVAYVDSGATKSWLIRPIQGWLDRGIWDPRSEKLHGLSRERLLAEGRPIEDVQIELAETMEGLRALSDAVTADSYWLHVLYWFSEPPFDLERVADIIRPATRLTGVAARERFLAAEAEARRRYPREHRAEPDARRSVEVLRILMGLA